MKTVQRKITYRLYPNTAQVATLMTWLALHCRAYNALLEEHRRRYEAKEGTFNFTAMCKALTSWRGYADSLASLNAQSLQVTAKRVALAFDAFFRRLKNGDTPGFPRFKSLNRFPGWGYKTYCDGWKLRAKATAKGLGYGGISLSGIGDIPMRGKGRFIGTPVTCEILHKHGKWYASVTFDVPEYRLARAGGTETAAFDWGIDTLLTIAKADGSIQSIENPRWLKNRLEVMKDLGRKISAEQEKLKPSMGLKSGQPIPEGKRLPITSKLKRLYAQLRALHSKVARQRKDFYHKLTAWLVETFGLLATEELNVMAMSRRPKKKIDENTGEALPNGASRKAGLNRGILDAAPSMLIGMIATKAVEAASWFAKAPTRKLKPTQRCHYCGKLTKKELGDRTHSCSCGCVCDRDENAAKTLLRWMTEGESWFGTSQAGDQPPETPPITA
jgi:putative transposase